jgi:hypothetical protein
MLRVVIFTALVGLAASPLQRVVTYSLRLGREVVASP